MGFNPQGLLHNSEDPTNISHPLDKMVKKEKGSI